MAQVGWLGKGVVYASLGWAAIEIGLDKPAADEAEYTGIVSSLAGSGLTRVLLALIAVGLVLYILFRLMSIALIDENDLDAWAHRVGYFASVVTYTAIAWAAGSAAIRGARPESGSTVEQVSKALLEATAGRVALVIGGIVALGIAGYFVVKGVSRRFMSQIQVDECGPIERRIIEVTGAIGWVGRGIVVGIVALFVTWSAIDADPTDARGLDSSLHRLSGERTFGEPIVILLGVTLLVYALYCIVSSRRRRLAWEDNPEPASDDAGHPTSSTGATR